LSPLDAVGSSLDFQEAKRLLFEYIDFLWNEYVQCPEEELGETRKDAQRFALGIVHGELM